MDPLYLYRGNVIDKDSKLLITLTGFLTKDVPMQYDRIEHLALNNILVLQLVLIVMITGQMEPIKREMQAVHNVLKAGGHYTSIFTMIANMLQV